ncbi:MAG: SAM-dependent methyltransferase [Acidiferrobacteraceae bacterium]|nr:SAM-dependent methyltransferase [Acidiferrobacteraceae bacterium]
MSRKTSMPAYRKRKSTTQAQAADRHALYEKAVQCVESEIDMVDENFMKLRGRPASSLREDFCGTANTSCEWVRRRPSNLAIGIDTDTSVLDWGRAHNLSQLEKEQEERITLLNDDVMSVATPNMDIILAMNFSYQIFKDRDRLREYFHRVYGSLKSDGLFFLDAFGGYEAFREMEEATEFDDFTYIWDQHHYNPINGDITCLIHFKFPDGSKLKRAFRYDWRLWTLPELQELLVEAGFSRVLVYWEGTDSDTGEGNGEYIPTQAGEADAGWICYISAEK